MMNMALRTSIVTTRGFIAKYSFRSVLRSWRAWSSATSLSGVRLGGKARRETSSHAESPLRQCLAVQGMGSSRIWPPWRPGGARGSWISGPLLVDRHAHDLVH